MIISRTNVGSHMWGMQRPDSDNDIFEIYLADTKEVLLQERTPSYQKKNGNDDVAGHELGKVAQMLLVGNVNFIWGTFSPIIITETPSFRMLQVLAMRNLSSQPYYSIRGLALHNLAHLGEEGMTEKKARIILRTLNFGIAYLETKKFVFAKNDEPLPSDYKQLELTIQERINKLTEAFNHSNLPEKPEAPNLLQEFVISERIQRLF